MSQILPEKPESTRPAGTGHGREHERGAALFIALVLTIVITFLGMGLLTRSLLVSQIAGAERWSTKTFYAADTGIAAAKSRLRVSQRGAFDMELFDVRPHDVRVPIVVNVSRLLAIGNAQPAPGSQTGGGQGGGSEAMVVVFYKVTSRAQQSMERTGREITSTLCYGPVPMTEDLGIVSNDDQDFDDTQNSVL